MALSLSQRQPKLSSCDCAAIVWLFFLAPTQWGRGLRRVSRSVAETYSELGEGDIAGKTDILDISPVIEAPLT
jgi:hypothetical protein